MNKFNPLYILLFSIILFLYSAININLQNTTLLQVQEENKQYLKIATKYNSLQNAWGKNNNTKKKIEYILKLSNIKNAHITIKDKIIKIKIENTKLKSLDKFMNKVLNETIVIINFSLTKNSLLLEVGV